jgi:hypothetical protein
VQHDRSVWITASPSGILPRPFRHEHAVCSRPPAMFARAVVDSGDIATEFRGLSIARTVGEPFPSAHDLRGIEDGVQQHRRRRGPGLGDPPPRCGKPPTQGHMIMVAGATLAAQQASCPAPEIRFMWL